jgi:YVTN family beta-propeller protein
VTNRDGSSVSVIDTTTNTVVATVAVSPFPFLNSPFGVAITPDGTRAYVTIPLEDSVAVIDTASNTVIGTVTLVAGSGPVGVAITPDGTRAYVTNLFVNSVSVIDTASNTVLATVPVGLGPVAVVITPGVGPPTDKDQCKNGGWKIFTIPRTFKNQGDCVSFVETGK